jgi:hypothetical protein
VIGETTKWVPVNNARITNIAYDASSVTVTAAGSSGEQFSVGGPWVVRPASHGMLGSAECRCREGGWCGWWCCRSCDMFGFVLVCVGGGVPTHCAQVWFYNSAAKTGSSVTCTFDESKTLVLTAPSNACWST